MRRGSPSREAYWTTPPLPMSNPFADEAQKDVWYPDELPELGEIELLSEEPIDNDDVPHEDAQYGKFVKVKHNPAGPDDEAEAWIACPRMLMTYLGQAEAEPGHTFRVESAHRGPEQHDPWELDVEHDL